MDKTPLKPCQTFFRSFAALAERGPGPMLVSMNKVDKQPTPSKNPEGLVGPDSEAFAHFMLLHRDLEATAAHVEQAVLHLQAAMQALCHVYEEDFKQAQVHPGEHMLGESCRPFFDEVTRASLSTAASQIDVLFEGLYGATTGAIGACLEVCPALKTPLPNGITARVQ